MLILLHCRPHHLGDDIELDGPDEIRLDIEVLLERTGGAETVVGQGHHDEFAVGGDVYALAYMVSSTKTTNVKSILSGRLRQGRADVVVNYQLVTVRCHTAGVRHHLERYFLYVCVKWGHKLTISYTNMINPHL